MGLDIVPHAKIPATWEVKIKRIMVQGQPTQKLVRPYHNKTSWAWWHVPVIPVMQEAQGWSWQKSDPI
jgi:hypothetical protein